MKINDLQKYQSMCDNIGNEVFTQDTKIEKTQVKQQIIDGLHITVERLIKESASLKRELADEKSKMVLMSFKDKIELISKLAHQIQYDSSVPESLVDEQEEFFMQLQNEILPALLSANNQVMYDSTESTFAADRAYFNKGMV